MAPRVLGVVPRVLLGVVPRVLGVVPKVLGVVPRVLGGRIGRRVRAVRTACSRRADAVRIVGTVAVRFESGRLQEQLKQLKWRKWLFRGSGLGLKD